MNDVIFEVFIEAPTKQVLEMAKYDDAGAKQRGVIAINVSILLLGVGPMQGLNFCVSIASEWSKCPEAGKVVENRASLLSRLFTSKLMPLNSTSTLLSYCLAITPLVFWSVSVYRAKHGKLVLIYIAILALVARFVANEPYWWRQSVGDLVGAGIHFGQFNLLTSQYGDVNITVSFLYSDVAASK